MARMERIAKANPYRSFNQKQKNRIKELKDIRAAQLRGENVDKEIAIITASLKNSGIIDKNGKLSQQYRAD